MPGLSRIVVGLVLATALLASVTAAGADDALAPSDDVLTRSRGHLHFPGSRRERLNIQGVVEAEILRPVLEAFHQRFPQITLNYRDASLGPRPTPDRIPPNVDLLMSSAMAQQYRLANAGLARPLGDGAINPDWPQDARWRNELIGLTHESLVMVYRRELADIAPPPADHAGLLALLTQQREALRGRVVTYNPARSPTGFMAVAQDVARSQEAWALFDAMGDTDTRLQDTTADMLDGLIKGRYLIGYNLIGSYARRVVREHPELALQVPTDYALALQRLALIPASAPHPETARRFLRFITSSEGQQIMTTQTPLGSPLLIRRASAEHDESLAPIALTPGLLALIDPLKREAVLDRWQTIFGRHGAFPPQAVKGDVE
ncbi:iron(III) transport system substrate-binding protein/two-component system, OmpR family, sensor histidine kinase TctE [Kushneria avicenniae]|uniref:Iron(III) transport system substrate-binding protein/two-component system, OmpR family, sensor histidine kinase TctE n=1 Tax=Kushneria avicenniae TaxID=402385 RepID=A0A1I1IJI7_9GAMM|nr:ABC transporter substrate-binding protein [Kushneria avicenniae]SFC36355.1 iron(III) transport system substrate-binding protein/two-component system, OmpR family, sensor histidine kinase TctE [Kushneria avicenniae]